MAGVPKLPKDSGELGKGAIGSMTPGAGYTPITELTTPYAPHPLVQIEVYTSAMVLCGVIDDYEYFQHVENWQDFDTFVLHINRNKTSANQLQTKRFIRFVADCKEHICIVESRESITDNDGKMTETLKVEGRGIEAILSRRVCEYGTTSGTGYHDTASAVVPTITFTFAASSTVTASSDCSANVKVGHFIYNSTNDTSSNAAEITDVSANGLTITLATAYAGTTGAGKTATVLGERGETALRRYVTAECISPVNSARIITGLSLAAVDSLRGGIVVRSVRDSVLSEILYGIATESGLAFRLVHTTGLNFVFTVYTGTDRSDTIRLSAGFENIGSTDYVENVLEMRNLLYVAGTGDGAARAIREVYTESSEPSGWDRYEKFIDASDCTTDALLDARGYETLSTLGESVSIEAEYLPSPTFTLCAQFDCGDIVTIETTDATEVSRIISIEREYDAGSGRVTNLTLGSKAPDLKSIVKNAMKIAEATSRR